MQHECLGCRDKGLAMLKQAREAGISGLLHIPIVLLMVCAVFMEKNSLPKTKTGIVKVINDYRQDNIENLWFEVFRVGTPGKLAGNPGKVIMGSPSKGYWTAASEQGTKQFLNLHACSVNIVNRANNKIFF